MPIKRTHKPNRKTRKAIKSNPIKVECPDFKVEWPDIAALVEQLNKAEVASLTSKADDINEEHAIELLRRAGCTCPVPLVGYRPGVGPRCRMCNTVAKENSNPVSLGPNKYFRLYLTYVMFGFMVLMVIAAVIISFFPHLLF